MDPVHSNSRLAVDIRGSRIANALGVVVQLALATFLIVLIWCMIDLRHFIEYNVGPRLIARDNQVQQFLSTADRTSRDNAVNLSQTLTNLRALTGDADDAVEQVTAALLDDKNGLLPRSNALVGQLNQAVMDADIATKTLNTEIASTGATTRATLEPLRQDLANIVGVILTAQTQIHTTGTASTDTLRSLDKALIDADTLISDPQIHEAIQHTNASMESIDIALRPWRKKAALLKLILEKMLAAGVSIIPWFLK